MKHELKGFLLRADLHFFFFSLQRILVDAWFCMVSTCLSEKEKWVSLSHLDVRSQSGDPMRDVTKTRSSLVRRGGTWGFALRWYIVIWVVEGFPSQEEYH